MDSNPCFCDGLQQRAVKIQVCRSALDSTKHKLKGGDTRRGFAICLQHGRGKIKRN